MSESNLEQVIHQVEDLVFNSEGPFPALFSMQYVSAAGKQEYVWRVMIQTDNRTSVGSNIDLIAALEHAVAHANTQPQDTQEGISGGLNQGPPPAVNPQETAPTEAVNPGR